MTSKILLIGSQGQVGSELSKMLPRIGNVICTGRQQLDLTNVAQIRDLIQSIKPHIIVNSAAYTAVDQAESESELAAQINAIAPQTIAEESQKLGSILIHLSTDYVFDGQKNTPYRETDLTNPLGVYGKSKLAGEENIKATNGRFLILRTAWVYGVYGKGNFAKTMLRLGAEREQLKVVMDQIGCPTCAEDIAKVITSIIPQLLDKKDLAEIYHFTNLGVCSWYDFAVNIFRQAQRLNYPLKIQEVMPITTAEYPTPAQRPAYSVLSTRKLSNDFNFYPNYWQDSLEKTLKKLLVN
jgi:dTDP-4-dehydrorhamnose reductase